MLLIDGRHLRKRYVYPNNVFNIHHNSNHIWPYITGTLVGEWEISLSASPTNISKNGGAIILSCSASRVITYIWVNYDGNTYEYFKTQTVETGVCVLGTTFGKLTENTLIIPSNPYDYDRSITVTAHCGGVTKKIKITQGYGSLSYTSDIQFDYSTTQIPYTSDNESVSEYIKIFDTVGILKYDNGSVYEETLDPSEYSVSFSNVKTSENSEQTVVKYLCTITITSEKYGTSSKTVEVLQQAAPKPTITEYGNWVLELSADKESLPNSGGTVLINVNCYRTLNWSNGKSTIEQSTNPVILNSNAGQLDQSQVDVQDGQNSTTLIIGENTNHNTANIVIEAKCNKVTKSVSISQEAADKQITSTGNWIVNISASPSAIGYSSTDVQITVNCYRTVYWSDNTTSTEQSTDPVVVSIGSLFTDSLSVIDGPSSTSVTIPENNSTSQKTYTATATCNGASDSIDIEQAGIVSVDGDWTITITASPNSLPQEGGTSSIYAQCSRVKADGSIEYASSDITLSTTRGELSTSSVSSSGGNATLTLDANDQTYAVTAIVKAECMGLSDIETVSVEGGPKDEEFWSISYVASTIEAHETTNTCSVMFNKFDANGSTVLDTVPATSASGVNIGSITTEPSDYSLAVFWTGDANTSENSREITFTASNDSYGLSGTVSFTQRGTVVEEPVGEWMQQGVFMDIDASSTTNSASNVGFICWDGTNITDSRPLTSVSADIGDATITYSADLCSVEWTGPATTTGRLITITGSNDVTGLSGTWSFKQGDINTDNDVVYISVSTGNAEENAVSFTASSSKEVASDITISGVTIKSTSQDGNEHGNYSQSDDVTISAGTTSASGTALLHSGTNSNASTASYEIVSFDIYPTSDNTYNYVTT